MLRTHTTVISLLSILLVFFSGVQLIRAQKSVPLQIPAFSSRLAGQNTSFLSQDALIKMEKTSPQASAGKKTAAPLSARDLAENFLEANKARFGIENVQDELKLTRIRKSPGGEHYTYDACVQDIPVYHSQIVVSLNRQRHITFIMSNYRPHLRLNKVTPSLGAAQALQIARTYLHASGTGHSEPETKLMVFETAAGGRLAYRVRLGISDPLGDWQLFVDADNGEILEISNALCFRTGVQDSGAVWIPDPLTMAEKYYGETGYTDNDDQDSDSLNNMRITVPLSDLADQGSSGELSLKGPHIEIAEDLFEPKYNLLTGPDSGRFVYTRTQPEFEAVMVYYHADQCYRRLMALGFGSDSLADLKADPHGGYVDNSLYSTFGNFCAFGEGGVDDAEDATVIWHEYAHAIQRNLSNVQFGARGETFSLLEGGADYWAASYKRHLSEFEWAQLFIWDAGIQADGDTTFWAGRRCDKDWHYPEDYMLYDSTHIGGQIWSSALMHVWAELGADVTDALFLGSHNYWSETPGFKEAAESMIQADRDMFESSHLAVLGYWFDHYGFIDRTNYLPRIIHTPYNNTEDLTGPYTVTCQILTNEAALNLQDLWLFWKQDSLAVDSVRLVSTGGDEYSASIAGSGVPATIRYYMRAGDLLNQEVTYPANAPLEQCLFNTGPDTILPVINHQNLGDQLLISWPPEISAVITDNLGIDSAWVEFYLKQADSLRSFYLQPGDSDMYTGQFPDQVSGLQDGDSVHYRIIARDLAAFENRSSMPEEGFYYFVLYQNPAPPHNLHVLDRDDVVQLGWDENIQKVPVYYNIYRSGDDQKFALLDSTNQTQYSDTTVFSGRKYHYYLTTVFGEWESLPSDTVEVIVETVVTMEDESPLPRTFKLEQNHPNPFNPRTRIRYELPMGAEVRLQIYNLLGQNVATLVSAKQPAGVYEVEWDARDWASGVYLYRLQAGSFVQVRKLILLK